MLPLGEDDGLARTLRWPELRELAVTADEAGLDALWAPDHLIFRHGDRAEGIRECWTLLSAVAAVTQRVTIGPLVLATPFRNPGLTAKMAAELDEVSDGRLILGLGCGWHEPEFTDFGLPFDHRVGRFEEGLSIILPLLREGRADVRGRWYATSTELLPAGPRPAGPPILIAGKGPRMLRLVARHADLWNAAWYGPPDEADELRARIERLHAACAEVGRDPATLGLTAGVFVHFPELARDGDEPPPASVMRGTVDEVGAMLAGYRASGIGDLIVHLWPRRPDAVGMLARAAEVARAATSAEAAP
jgi:alkanesulfonate monooxygenase SsuD/methylene tetrahydromethanopterin reductase-like flavin-dependent oxidoreductase (luciferase family)